MKVSEEEGVKLGSEVEKIQPFDKEVKGFQADITASARAPG